jgi:alkanesulfonate monooxygenase SsuD/methylene tetrahydromethanopterin reductase-like flavin-dependent oxidoreductase (luciferase family)
MARRDVKRQMGVALSDDLREQLERAAEEAGHSIAEEIRVRIARTFQQEAIDPVTRELLEGIINLAEIIRADLGAEWHAYSGNHAAFVAAIAQRLRFYKPSKGTVSEKEQTTRNLLGAEEGLFTADDAPEVIGRTHERYDQRRHKDRYEHLIKAERARMARMATLAGLPEDAVEKIKKEGDVSGAPEDEDAVEEIEDVVEKIKKEGDVT